MNVSSFEFWSRESLGIPKALLKRVGLLIFNFNESQQRYLVHYPCSHTLTNLDELIDL
ncbi:hypothetical protein GCM10008013_15180 [Paenibacillus segetis]|uniref:Uncharacterized protein n=1 Tax=Paenibacillus segetis TaxID=1325360 RepID=A0ABQ1YBT2_9BACL|nr:hypothetical protein GCM10008013_15180 [Paenibacillus segetis]